MSSVLGASARSHTSRLLTVMVGVVALLLAAPQVAHAAVNQTPEPSVKVQGIVYGVAHLPSTGQTFVGGSFTGIGTTPSSNIGAFDKFGFADKTFKADTDGTVYAVALSKDGSTLYIGGTFTQVNGTPRANLAALDLQGNVKPLWQADTNGAVRALEVSGDRLYVGGSFNTLDASQKGRLVALDTNGNLVNGFFPRPSWTVRDLAATSDGTKIYAVGGFTAVGGVSRANGVAEIKTSDGQLTGFDPATGGGIAIAVDVTPNGSRMFFSTENNSVFAYDPASNTPVWVTKNGGDTQAIEATNDEIFIGGHFRNITTWKVKRNLAASLYVKDGSPTPWNPHFSGDMGPWAIQLAGDMLVYGGDFSHVGGQLRYGMARFKVTP